MIWIVRILIALALLAAIEFYFFRSLRNARKFFPFLRRYKIPAIIGFFINLMPFALLFQAVYGLLTSGSISLPSGVLIDWLFVYPFWISFVLVVQLLLFFIPLDFIGLFLKLKKSPGKYFAFAGKLKIALLFFFLIYVPLISVYDYYSVKITRIEERIPNLPNSLKNFKIGFVSDFHVDRYTDSTRVMNYISKLNALKPDVVLIGGDFISRGSKYIKAAAKLLGNIHGAYGAYSCAGDHDYWAYSNAPDKSFKTISSALALNGITLLDNSNIVIPVDSAKLLITFVTNTYVKKISPAKLPALLDSNAYDFKILLTHQPRKFLMEAASKYKYGLYLCGHTHGGQLSFLFPFIELTPSMLESPYVSGKYFYKKLLVYVCNGLGMSIAPIRYNSTPEVVLIKLVK